MLVVEIFVNNFNLGLRIKARASDMLYNDSSQLNNFANLHCVEMFKAEMFKEIPVTLEIW